MARPAPSTATVATTSSSPAPETTRSTAALATTTLDGQGDTDTAVFTGTVAAHTFALNGAGQVVVTGTGGNTDGSDTLVSIERVQFGAAPSFVLNAGTATDNTLNAGAIRPELFLGFDGTDTVSYAANATAVTANLGNQALNAGGALGDVFVSIENLTGSGLNDSLTGDALANALSGGAGDDSLTGGAGNDTLDGGTNTAAGDTALFSGLQSDYTISQNGANYIVTDNRAVSPDGTDTLINMENVKFGAAAAVTLASLVGTLNLAPTSLTLTPSPASIPENGANVVVASIVAADDAKGNDVFSLSGADAAAFAIENTGHGTANLRFVGGANYEVKSAYDVTVQVADAALGSSLSQAFHLDVTNLNEAPSGTNKTITMNEDATRAFSAGRLRLLRPERRPHSECPPGRRDHVAAGLGQLAPQRHTGFGKPGDPGCHLGQLSWTPALNTNGNALASFTFAVRDNGGTGVGDVNTDPTANTITFNVTPVGDPTTGSVNIVSESRPGANQVTLNAGNSFVDPDGPVTTTYQWSNGTNGASTTAYRRRRGPDHRTVGDGNGHRQRHLYQLHRA